MLDLLYTFLDHIYAECLVIFIAVQNLIEICAVILLIGKFNILRASLKTPIRGSKMGFWRI